MAYPGHRLWRVQVGQAWPFVKTGRPADGAQPDLARALAVVAEGGTPDLAKPLAGLGSGIEEPIA